MLPKLEKEVNSLNNAADITKTNISEGKGFSGRRTVAVEQALREKVQRHAFCGRILGIDPSLRGTGLAVLEVLEDRRKALVYSKTLKISARESLLACTGIIHQGIVEVLKEYQPELCAAEQTIYGHRTRGDFVGNCIVGEGVV